MDYTNLVLHVLHIVSGVVWAGGAILMGLFVSPSAMATRPESAKFMQYLTGPAKLPVWMTLASWVTVICGVIMFSPMVSTLPPGVMATPRGISLGLGALLALGAFVEGMALIAPAAHKMGKLGAAIAASGKGPTPEQVQQMQVLQDKLSRGTRRGAVLLLLTVVCMATARWI